MEVTVRIVGGGEEAVEVKPGDTVGALLSRIHAALGLGAGVRPALLLNGDPFEPRDDEPVAGAGISGESVFDVVAGAREQALVALETRGEKVSAKRLKHAVKCGDTELVGLLLAAQVRTASCLLHTAANTGHVAVAMLLLEYGCNVDAENSCWRTALIYAAQKGHEGVVKLLLEKGCNVNAFDRDENTALIYAAQEGHEGVVKLLVESGCNLYNQQMALLHAAQEGHEGVVKLLLEKECDMSHRSVALIHAANQGREGTVRLLLESGCSMKCKKEALFHAAQQGQAGTARLLLQYGCEVDGAIRGHASIARLLLEKWRL